MIEKMENLLQCQEHPTGLGFKVRVQIRELRSRPEMYVGQTAETLSGQMRAGARRP